MAATRRVAPARSHRRGAAGPHRSRAHHKRRGGQVDVPGVSPCPGSRVAETIRVPRTQASRGDASPSQPSATSSRPGSTRRGHEGRRRSRRRGALRHAGTCRRRPAARPLRRGRRGDRRGRRAPTRRRGRRTAAGPAPACTAPASTEQWTRAGGLRCGRGQRGRPPSTSATSCIGPSWCCRAAGVVGLIGPSPGASSSGRMPQKEREPQGRPDPLDSGRFL